MGRKPRNAAPRAEGGRAGAFQVGGAQGQRVLPFRHLAPHQPVGLLVFQKYDRVVVPNGRLEQSLGIVGRGRCDHLQPWGMEEHRLYILRVEQPSAYAPAVGNSHHHRHVQVAVGAIANPRRFADELVHAGPHEIGELDFWNGPQASECRSQGDTHDRCFGQGRVDHPILPELLQESLCRKKYAAPPAHVLTQNEDFVVVAHFLRHRLADCFDYSFNGHISYCR